MKIIIPPANICPSCKKVQHCWAVTPVGVTLCAACTAAEDHSFVVDNRPIDSVERRCTACGTYVKLRRNIFETSDGWLCRSCARHGERLVVGTYRIDSRSRAFKVNGRYRALYCYGESRLPNNSKPSVESVWRLQQLQMWTRVQEEMPYALMLRDLIALKNQLPACDWGELLDDGVLPGLMRAAAIQDDSRRNTWRAFATRCMQHRATMYLARRTRHMQSHTSLVEDVQQIEYDEDNERLMFERVQNLEGKLSADEMRLVRRLFCDGATYDQLTREFGVLHTTLHNRVTRIKRRLNKGL